MNLIFPKFLVLIIIITNCIKFICALKYDLSSGKFQAKEIEIDDFIVHKLSSIPYANVPFAFDKSFARKHGESYFNETMTKTICIEANIFFNLFYGNFQPDKNVEISFDCLRIDIYIPIRKGENKKRANMTVLLFIHGGSNASGTSSTFDGAAMAAYGDVIVAVPNYRLDVLGFFHSKENNIHGNYGLWDQVVALEWLDANCKHLGCNSKSITIFGHSAGAADAMLLGMSKKAQSYINRIIVQSGSALAHWAIDNYESVAVNKNWENKLKSLSENFLQVTTCEKTMKYKCLKEKVDLIVDDNEMFTPFENYLLKILKELNHFDLMEVLNYIYEINKSLGGTNTGHHYRTSDYRKTDFLNHFKLNHHFKTNSKKIKRSDFDDFLKISSIEECMNYFESKLKPESLQSICEFFNIFNQTSIKSMNLDKKTVVTHKIVKNLLLCFHQPYQRKNKDQIDHNLVIRELKVCTNDAINASIEYNQHRNHLAEKDKELLSRKVSNSLSEIGLLVNKETMLYTPIVDNDLIHDNPFKMLENENFLKIDTMVGVTAEECFYMLDHSYLLTDVFENLLMQSKNLNLTNNIEEKFKSIQKEHLMRECLKENIYSFYEKLLYKKKKSPKSKSRVFEEVSIISDYEIKLPFINFLKTRAEYLAKKNLSNLFVYEFAYAPSFNYLLDQARTSSYVLEEAYKIYKGAISPHNTELDFVFGLPMLSKTNNLNHKSDKYFYNYAQNEVDISILMIKYWTNFAKYG